MRGSLDGSCVVPLLVCDCQGVVIEVGPSEQRGRGPWESLPLLHKGQIRSGPPCPSSAWGEAIRSCKAVLPFDWENTEAQKLGTPTRERGHLGVKLKQSSGCCMPGPCLLLEMKSSELLSAQSCSSCPFSCLLL